MLKDEGRKPERNSGSSFIPHTSKHPGPFEARSVERIFLLLNPAECKPHGGARGQGPGGGGSSSLIPDP